MTANISTFQEFLERAPILVAQQVSVAVEEEAPGRKHWLVPSIQAHCPHELCGGRRMFDPVHASKQIDIQSMNSFIYREEFLRLKCRNCKQTTKIFAVILNGDKKELSKIKIQKVGELPRFGEPRPDAVKDVLDDEVGFFDRGYRAETDGLGIGAFGYYRRFVESHKDKIMAAIRKVAVAQNMSPAKLALIDRAAQQREFSKAVATVKDGIPSSFFIKGHNPLTLLHNALSAGLHNEDDVECLALAQDIRTVLIGLAERTTAALKDSEELDAAVTRLGQKASGQVKRKGSAKT